jgi:DNA polymerase-3 subunit alpha
MSIKDVARVMDLPLPDSNALAKWFLTGQDRINESFTAPLTARMVETSLMEKDGVGLMILK